MTKPSPNITIFHLEMTNREDFRPSPAPVGFEVQLVDPPNPELNREFYNAVGAPWKWMDRLAWSKEDWKQCVRRDSLKTYVAQLKGEEVGYFELESQDGGDVEIVYFGLLPEYIGKNLGGPLLSVAVEAAWNLVGTRRVWVHTCTHDHQHALANYQKRGFKLFKTEQKETTS